MPEGDRPDVRARLRSAWALADRELARRRLELLATRARPTPGDSCAGISTVTLMRLGSPGSSR